MSQHYRPATSIDAVFLKRSGLGAGPDGELWSSFSPISGSQYSSVFVAQLKTDYLLTLEALGYPSTVSVAVVEANTTSSVKVIPAGGGFTVNQCGQYDFQVYSVAPILSNGEAWMCVRACIRTSVRVRFFLL